MVAKTVDPFPSLREIARAAGEKTYLTGKPCPKGHNGPRYVANYFCVACQYAREVAGREEKRERNRLYRIEHPDRAKASNKKWRVNNQAQYDAYNQSWRAANPDKVKQYVAISRVRRRPQVLEDARRWRAENPERRLESFREWCAKNPERVRALWNKRRARKIGALGSHTADDIIAILRMQRHRCAYCAKRLGNEYDIDHIVPLAKGGSNWPANLQALCGRCNNRKHVKDAIAFAQELGKLL